MYTLYNVIFKQMYNQKYNTIHKKRDNLFLPKGASWMYADDPFRGNFVKIHKHGWGTENVLKSQFFVKNLELNPVLVRLL